MFTLSAFGDEISPYLSDQIELLKEEGIKYIELRGVNNKNVLDFTDDEIKKIKKALDSNNFKISAIGSPIGKIGIMDDFSSHLEKFERSISLAKYFDTPYIRIFSYYMPEGENPAEYRKVVMERMLIKTKIAEKNNIILLHENERRIYGDLPDRCRDILKTINSNNLKAIFDAGNFVFERLKPYADCYPKLSEFIIYLHIKDAKKTGNDIKTTVPGEGDGDIKAVLNSLKERNFSGFLSIEPHLAIAGTRSGFSGKDLFRSAIRGLKKVLTEINAEWN